jgi:hypothetical protein
MAQDPTLVPRRDRRAGGWLAAATAFLLLFAAQAATAGRFQRRFRAAASGPSVACRRASAGLEAARKRVTVADSRLGTALQRLRESGGGAAGPKRVAALRRSLARNRTRFENTKENRARAGRKAAARC